MPQRTEGVFVGDIVAVHPGILERLLSEDLIPVISTIGADERGQAYNINADTVAGAIAEALHAEKLVYLTDVPGLYLDFGEHLPTYKPKPLPWEHADHRQELAQEEEAQVAILLVTDAGGDIDIARERIAAADIDAG